MSKSLIKRSDQLFGSYSFVLLSVQSESLLTRSDQLFGPNSFVALSVLQGSLTGISSEAFRSDSFVLLSVQSESLFTRSDQLFGSNSYITLSIQPGSLTVFRSCSFVLSANLLTHDSMANSHADSQTKNHPFSRGLITRIDETDRFPLSHSRPQTDFHSSSLVIFSSLFDHTPSAPSSEDGMAAAGSAKVDATTLSILGTMSLLVLALGAAAALFLFIRMRRRGEGIDTDTTHVIDEDATDAFETMRSLASIDHYVTEVQAAVSMSLSSLSVRLLE
jgi:hypothetical protein